MIKKLQNLSEQKKIAIIAVVVGVCALVLGYFWVTSAMRDFSQIGQVFNSSQLPNIDLPAIDLPEADSEQNVPAKPPINTTENQETETTN